MINSIDVLFTTSRFNATDVKEHFINDCCFGEDLAAWLRDELAKRGPMCNEPGQEDWGWYLDIVYNGQTYMLGMSAMYEDNQLSKNCEWRIVVERKRSLKNKFKGLGRIQPDDPLLNLVLVICRSQTDFSGLRTES